MTPEEKTILTHLVDKVDEVCRDMVTMEALAPYLQRIEDHSRFIDGNGSSGAKSRIDQLELIAKNLAELIEKIENGGGTWARERILAIQNEATNVRALAARLKEENDKSAANHVKQEETGPWRTFKDKYLQPILLMAVIWFLFVFLPAAWALVEAAAK